MHKNGEVEKRNVGELKENVRPLFLPMNESRHAVGMLEFLMKVVDHVLLKILQSQHFREDL